MGAIVTSEFNGMRLTLAREIQNISSPKLAETIGVTKQTVFHRNFSLKVAAIILVPELHTVEQLQPRQEP